MFTVITMVLLVFIWTRPSTSIGLLGKVALTAMTLCTAAERFISVRPGYQIVKNQLAAARFPIAV